jgi:hypothetical protein
MNIYDNYKENKRRKNSDFEENLAMERNITIYLYDLTECKLC